MLQVGNDLLIIVLTGEVGRPILCQAEKSEGQETIENITVAKS